MNIFLYFILFIIGILFGSFYTLAIYRIPRKQDITHTQSFCPNCNHKLGFFDLFPLLSYTLLGAKCRYCKQKIKPTYFIIEFLSGIVFVLFGIGLNLNINNINIYTIINYSFIALYITYIFLISGIDYENIKVNKAVNIYGMVVALLYIVYLCIIGKASIYRYVIYLIIYILTLIINNITIKKYAKDTYLNGIIIMMTTLVILGSELTFLYTAIITLLSISIYLLALKIKNKRKKLKKDKKQEELNNVPIAFYLGISNLISYIFLVFLTA